MATCSRFVRRSNCMAGAAACFPVNELDGTAIEPLGIPAPTLSSDEIGALVAYLETLTDDRVRVPARSVRSSAALRA